ncbi:MAG: hypothetical protein CM15mP69_6940 [Ectothiorhodospiraceae bacterium]|nr:MAG: hypothetical protein CM15mP69_6940 [Ectothiorhodospiraceae bacterium]
MKMRTNTEREQILGKKHLGKREKNRELLGKFKIVQISTTDKKEDDSKVKNLNLSETNKEDNILTDRNKKIQKYIEKKECYVFLKVKKVEGILMIYLFNISIIAQQS